MRARIRDSEIFFDIDGLALVPDGSRMRERPTALLVHGGPGTDHATLKTRYGRLAEQMQLVYFDQRGHGRSSRGDPAKYCLDENVEDLEALRQYLGLERIVSIGTSYGGRVAMAHAARYPAAVSHLVLIATAANPRSLTRAEEIVAERGTPEQVAASNDLYAGRLDTPDKLRRYFEVLGPMYSRNYNAAAAGRLGLTMYEPEPINRAFGPGGFMHSLDLRPELANIAAPTLILAGGHDFRCAPEFSEEMHRLIPGSRLQIFEDSGHNIAADEPVRCLDTIADFIAE